MERNRETADGPPGRRNNHQLIPNCWLADVLAFLDISTGQVSCQVLLSALVVGDVIAGSHLILSFWCSTFNGRRRHWNDSQACKNAQKRHFWRYATANSSEGRRSSAWHLFTACQFRSHISAPMTDRRRSLFTSDQKYLKIVVKVFHSGWKVSTVSTVFSSVCTLVRSIFLVCRHPESMLWNRSGQSRVAFFLCQWSSSPSFFVDDCIDVFLFQYSLLMFLEFAEPICGASSPMFWR